jgi:CubicO group peptidase (beta-lactamase class C family)
MSPNLLRAAALVLVAVVLASGPTVAAAEPVPNYAAIDHYVQLQLEANHFPGVAVAIVDGDSIAHVQGFGHDARGQPVTPRTPFMIGSNSKSFAALATMQLVGAG